MLPPMRILEKPIAIHPWRPLTAVYPDRHRMGHYRDEHFPPTASEWDRIFCVNLEGGFFAPGAIKELILPLAQAIRSGSYGAAVLVIVTSDDAVGEFLEALAKNYQLPIFLSTSAVAPLRGARPIGALTTVELETYGLIRTAGGEVTSSRVADLAGIEGNAASNRLSALDSKGYIHRVSRSRREGDVFVDLLSAAEQNLAAPPHVTRVEAAAEEFTIPQDVRESVQLLAKSQGSDPGEMLLRAWREFLDRHGDVPDSESKEIRRMLKENDREGLAAYANRRNRERAKQAAARTKR